MTKSISEQPKSMKDIEGEVGKKLFFYSNYHEPHCAPCAQTAADLLSSI